MTPLSTYQAAKKLGIAMTSLRRYIADDKVPAPKATKIGRNEIRAWTERDIERVREILPNIENGRKPSTRSNANSNRRKKSNQRIRTTF